MESGSAMRIKGLNEDENALVERLLKRLEAKRARNMLRSAYMDGRHMLRRLPPTAPPYLSNLRAVLGWPAKAVELLARRIRLEGFALAEGSIDKYGFDEIIEPNAYFAQVNQAQISSLVHATVFQTVNTGGSGEPNVLINQVSALNGTGEWNYRLRELANFLAISQWPQKPLVAPDFSLIEQSSFTLYHDWEIITVVKGAVVDRRPSLIRVPVVQMPYKPRLDRPFGASRISRPVMSLTDSAVRTILRSEGTADFYGTPWFMIFGPSEDAFSKDSWQLIMDRVNAIPDNEDAAHPRADVKQFSQASQQPHVEQLQVLAGLFAGETSIPVSSLGIGLTQANPTSAESYLASREDLIAEAEDAQTNWSPAHQKTMQWAWMIANNEPVLPDELRRLMPVWRDTRFTSRAAAADAIVKLVTAFPWMGESDAIIETLGYDKQMTERLKADKRRASVSLAFMDIAKNLEGEAPGKTQPEPTSAEVSAASAES